MSKSRVEKIDNDEDRHLAAEQKMLVRVSKDGLQVGDILLFNIPDKPRMSDRFIQFAQRRKGISEDDSACVHTAIVSKVTPSGTAVISHYLNKGLAAEPLNQSPYSHHPYDVIRLKDDKNNELKGQIAKEAREPLQSTPDNNTTSYSTLKAIVSFLRSQNVNNDKVRGYVPGYFAEENNREICSSFVARIIKKVQGEESNLDSSFVLPGQLRNKLANNPNFEVNPTQTALTVTLPISDERRPEAAVAAGRRKERKEGAAEDPDASANKVEKHLRKHKHRNDDGFTSAESSNDEERPRLKR